MDARSCEPEQALGVAVVNLVPILVREIHRVDAADRLADIHRALLGVERRIRREQHVIDAEEREGAFDRRFRAERRRAGVEVAEVVDRALLELLQERSIVDAARARAELIPSWADAPFEE